MPDESETAMDERRVPDTTRLGLPDDDDAGTARAIVDERGTVTQWGEGARRLLGYSPADIVGKPAASLLDEEPSADTLRNVKSLMTWQGTVPLRHQDGHRVEMSVLAQQSMEGKHSHGWLLVSALTHTAVEPGDTALTAWTSSNCHVARWLSLTWPCDCDALTATRSAL
ncbi:PAS domain-containing protein [Streptomyces sp. NBC_00370]|uniref:PAS domain-containing protein n=1 Tax=Streptomyces sp. NBC_00370 TaxID=2975728 RepID=UPI002E2599A1